MNIISKSRVVGALIALTLGCVAFAVPSTAVAAPSVEQASFKHQVKVQAKPEKDHIKVGEHVKVRGHLAIDKAERSNASETLVVQQLQAGVWVDMETTTCESNADFAIDLSFDVAASLTLRVLYPETDLNVEASSDVFALVVI